MRDEDDQLYIYELYGIKTPRKIKADKELRAKIGVSAKIEAKDIEKAQGLIDNSGLDYKPVALRHIKQLEGVIQSMRATDYNREQDYNMVSMPIMQIKGQAGMFGNHLASDVSYLILVFLEQYQRLDDSILDIVEVYIKAVRLSYDLHLYNSDSQGGKDIVDELKNALTRYRKRFSERTEKNNKPS